MIFQRKTAKVLGTPIDVLTWDEALERLLTWARNHDSRSVCICNVHSVVTAQQDPEFSQIVHEADMATPDGAPIAWMLRRLGFTGQARINGPDLMWRFCQECQKQHSGPPGNNGKADIPSLYLYGGSKATLTILQARLLEQFPGLTIAGAYSPPFRPLSDAEDVAVVEAINASGAGVVWVSLGCPKQEKWMAAHRGRINAVMVGVGAAFDYHAGTLQRAPLWMQHAGLEWLHRLASEPRRLWRRYLVTKHFVYLGRSEAVNIQTIDF